MKRRVEYYYRDGSGVTAIEYGLIAAVIALVILASVKSTGEHLRNTFDSVASSL
ncbi:MAG TPA: Flp family type IVb pilin [Rhizomicrobium sp.]|nr:Flp family type IVb pilin [Rhizomicrobium sp.]